jgi:copper homeostasis protein
VTLEVCVDSLASAQAAKDGGASRLELCANLSAGGTTPSHGLIEQVRSRCDLKLHVLVRPRGGDFLYSDDEFAVMLRDVALAKSLGVDGVVIGALAADGAVDVVRMRSLIEAASPLSVTFHRAFDMAADPFAALDDVIALGCDRLLTSGQAVTAYAGRGLIAELVSRAGDRIAIMPGGGVSAQNAAAIVADTRVRELHASARVSLPSAMRHRNPNVAMGAPGQPEYELQQTSAARVAAIIRAANGQG